MQGGEARVRKMEKGEIRRWWNSRERATRRGLGLAVCVFLVPGHLDGFELAFI